MKQNKFATRHHKIHKGCLSLLMLASITIVSSCNDDGSSIGANILPKEEIVGVYNYSNHQVSTENFFMNIIQSDDVEYALLGELNDPDFGNAKSEFYGQLTLGSTVPNGSFKPFEGYMVDSAMIYLTYQKPWVVGDTLAKHTVSIYELTKPLSPLENYFSNMDLTGYYDESQPIAQKELNAKTFLKGEKEKTDSIWNIANKELQWSFRVNEATTQKLFNLDKAALTDREAFQEAFKGILITSDLKNADSEGSLMRFNILSQKSYMTLYYSYERRDKYNQVIDTVKYNYSFYFNHESVRANRFSNEAKDIPVGDPSANYLYIQSMAGSAAKIHFPKDIYNWVDSINDEKHRVGISTVDLVFNIDTTLSKIKKYALPSELQIKQKNAKTGKLETPTFLNTNGGYENAFIGGGINYNNFTYHFRFARGFFESVLNNDDRIFDREFYLIPASSKTNYSRVILRSSAGLESDTTRLKLDIKYVKFH